jgi:signal transduction histidine kinase
MVCGIWLIHNDIRSQTLSLLSQQNKINRFYLNEFKQTQSHLITTLTQNTDIQNYTTKKNDSAETLLYHFLKANTQIMQLRLIDLEGNEKIRFDRRRDGSLRQIPIHELQNKFSRPYFQYFRTLPKNAIGFSDFDLNIEHGKLDIPFNPTLRMGMPVYKNGVKQGVIVINYYMQEWITHLQKYNRSHFYLIDSEGYFLIHPNPQWEWSRYQAITKKATDYFQQPSSYFFPLREGEYRWINSNTIAFDFDLYGKKLLALYQPEVSPNEILIRRLLQFSSILLLSLFFIVAPLMHMIHLNARRVEEEKNKNERMLIHHARLGAMGNIISVIEHQWRQPLNSVGLIIQDLVSAFNHHELTQPYFAASEEKIMDQLRFMSQTLDAFRNFFYTDKDDNGCNLIDVTDEIARLYEMQFKTSGIILTVECKNEIGESYPVHYEKNRERFTLSTHSTEIKHILLNLISNAKDAIKLMNIVPLSKQTIIITLAADDSAVYIDVTDYAGGIDSSIVHKIFTPYFTTKESGTGLGLTIAKTLTEHFMHGSLSFETNTDEGWSKFSLVIPRTEK